MNMAARMAIPEAARRTPRVAPPSVEASLTLEFVHDGAAGRTILAASHQEPPLKVVRAFSVEAGAALAHLHNVSGGLLGGDRLALHVRLGPSAQVQLTTTGATRIYRPREDTPATTQTTEISVAENALLEYLPDPIIPFAGAAFSQRTTVRLENGAGLFWWEILAPGREAHNEIFQYECAELRTDLTALGLTIAAERVRLEPRNRPVPSLARLGHYRTWCTFYICRVGLPAGWWLGLEQELRQVALQFIKPGELLWGISPLVAHGLVVRGLGIRGRDMLPGLQAIWSTAKRRLYERDAVPPRKVN